MPTKVKESSLESLIVDQPVTHNGYEQGRSKPCKGTGDD